MNDLNSWIGEGVVSKTPEVFGNKTVVTIEMKRYFKDADGILQPETQFVELDGFNAIGTFMASLQPGQHIRCIGRFKKTVWEDKSGKTHSRSSMIAEHIEKKSLPWVEEPTENVEF